MLIPENSFSLIVTDVKGIKSVFELIQALKEDKIRLTLTHSDKHKITFKIKRNSEYTHKTIEQWFSDTDMKELLKTISIDTSNLTYVDEDAVEGFRVELDTKSLWDGDLIHITKKFWICGK